MKLFLATNSATSKTPYRSLLEAACRSAVANTPFEVFVIYDGKKEELNLPKAVTVIEHRHRCYETFTSSSRNTSPGFLRIASSTYLRTEVPYLCQKMGFPDEFALYTDYDVMFLKGDYTSLEVLRPEFFAACPEADKNDWSFINTGVIVLNLKTLLTDDEFILEQIRRGFDTYSVWDQSLYNEVYAGRFDKLPLEYNWKPYWGVRADARIIHFHGPKPPSVEEKHRVEDPSLQAMRKAQPEAYDYYEKAWEEACRLI